MANREGDGLKILQWHRKKAGTFEHVHGVVGNEFAGGVIPSKRFGAKAAWFRANTILYNLLSALRKLALPKEFAKAKPKRLRFKPFNTVGRVVHHARESLLRLTEDAVQIVFTIEPAFEFTASNWQPESKHLESIPTPTREVRPKSPLSLIHGRRSLKKLVIHLVKSDDTGKNFIFPR